MKLFNAFQITVFYSLAPFGVSWLSTQTFPWHGAAFWAGLIVYVVSFFFMVAAVRVAMDKVDW